MRRGLVLLALLFPTTLLAETPLSKFGWFADVVGACWVGTFPDGKTQHSHCYTSQFDQFIRGTATLAGEHDGRMTDQFSGDSVFAWDDKERRIVYYIWGSDGSHSRHEAYYVGEDLAFPVNSKKDPERIAFRFLWHRIDAKAFEVRREIPDGAGWNTELTVLYRRKAWK